MNTEQLLDSLLRDLQAQADPEFRVRAAEYIGHPVDRVLGVRTPVVREIAARYFRQIKSLDIDSVLDLCEALLETRLCEHRTIAFDWSFRLRNQYQPEYFAVLERWLEEYVDDWSSCDDLCCHALGDFVLRYPEFVSRVKAWSHSKSRWLRRASAVTFIYGARRGQSLEHVLAVADALLTDPEDIVQKAYGWALKVASKTHQEEIFAYVMRNKSAMPRTALRYAIAKMPDELRREAMKKA
jgi:3-methyladenine DNA glycosylase AlkD